MDENWGLIGNERAVRVLQAGLANGAANHAYIFAGPEGTGRATAARRLAQALNCTGSEPPCGECAPCRRIDSGIHADVQTVTLDADAEGAARKAISVEQMREVETGRCPCAVRGTHARCDHRSGGHPVGWRAECISEDAGGAAASRCLRANRRATTNYCWRRSALAARVSSSASSRPLTSRRRWLRVASKRTVQGCWPDSQADGPGWAIEAAADPKLLAHRAEVLATARSLPRIVAGGPNRSRREALGGVQARARAGAAPAR